MMTEEMEASIMDLRGRTDGEAALRPPAEGGFVIKANTVSRHESCVICGFHARHAGIPYAVFLIGTWQAVCTDCTQRFAPELAKVLGGYWATSAADEEGVREEFQRAGLREHGDELTPAMVQASGLLDRLAALRVNPPDLDDLSF